MDDVAFSLDKPFIKIEADDLMMCGESEINLEGISTECDSLLPKSVVSLRSSRINTKTSIVTSEVNNIYAKPRMHFTGRGIVTKTQPASSFSIKRKRGRKPKIKEKIRTEKLGSESSLSKQSQGIFVDLSDPPVAQRSTKDIKVEVEVNSTPESESYFYIKKRKDRKFPKMVLTDDNLIDPSYYIDFNGLNEAETNVTDKSSSENQPNPDQNSNVNCFLNKKMFKRIGNHSDCLVECTLCFKQMKDTSMKQHFKSHSGLKPFVCNFCGARFTRKGDVYRHRKTIHRNIKPFECSMCERRFAQRKGLISHLQNHDRMLHYTCPTCGFKFGKREYYENHVRFIHPLTEGQSLTDVKDIYEKGMKQLDKLLLEEKEEAKSGKKPSLMDHVDLKNEEDSVHFELKNIKEEAIDSYLEENDIDSLMPESDFSQENPEDDPDLKKSVSSNAEDISVVRGTLSFNQTLSPQKALAAQEEEELVDKAIRAAITQAEMVLENIQSTVGNNMTSKPYETLSKNTSPEEQANSKQLQPKSSEIHISAMVGGSLRKFIVQIPSGGSIDATTQEGMDTLVNMVNHLCSGKGELNGPVEVVMHHTV